MNSKAAAASNNFAVRSAIVTGSTVAAIIGAQSLMMMNSLPVQPAKALGAISIEGQVSAQAESASPNILVLRRPGQQSSTGNTAPAGVSIVAPQAPAAFQIVPPAPVVTQTRIRTRRS